MQQTEELIRNTVHLAISSAAPISIQISGKQRELPEMGELCHLAARVDNYALLKERIPGISTDDIAKLKDALTIYLRKKSKVQQLVRAGQKLAQYNAETIEENRESSISRALLYVT